MKKKILSIMLCICLLLISGCQNNTDSNNKQIIVTTNYITYTLTKQIVQNTADVSLVNVVSSDNIDSKDLRTLRSADVLIYQGDELDPWVNTVLTEELKDSNIKTINALKGISYTQQDYESNLFKEDEEIQISTETSESSIESTHESEIESSEITESEDNTKLQSDLFVENPESEENSTEIESEETTEEVTEEVTEEIQLYLDSLSQYDVVEYTSPIRDYLVERHNFTGSRTIEYTLNGKTYIFGYSNNYDAFFLLDVKTANAYTDNDYLDYWFSFDNIKIIAENIKESLGLITDNYSAVRAQNYNSFLEQLNSEITKYNQQLKEGGMLVIACDYIPFSIIENYNLKYCCIKTQTNTINLRTKTNYCNYLERNGINVNLMTIKGDSYAKEIADELFLSTSEFNTLQNVDDIEKTYIEYMEENLLVLTSCIN